jgi:cation:H+ antiporter
MILQICLIIIGAAFVILGADKLTEGAAALARKMKMSEMIIGLTIVAAGTSAPELFSSLVSALKDKPDMAVGNVLGSNIFNTMLIVGCAAMVAPMTITKSTVRKDIPFAVFASMLLMALCADGFDSIELKGKMISRIDGILLLIGFIVFMAYTLRGAKGTDAPEASTASADMKVWKSVLFVVLGLAGLVIGSNLFVDSASSVASSLGVSDGVIGLTIVAGGTSLPELATSVVAARKGQSAMAIGNVIGSNVFNILFILSLTAIISPMEINGITLVDISMLLGSILLLWMFSFTKYTVARWEGALLSLGFFAYLAWLLYNV